MVSVSDKALHEELVEIEAAQLRVGENIAKLLFEQVRLAEKSKAVVSTMNKLLKQEQ